MTQMLKKMEGFQGEKAIAIPRPVLKTRCEKNEIIKRLYVTDIGYYPKAAFHYRERPQGSDQHILIYCMEGCGYFSIAAGEFRIQAGDFFVIPARTAHAYRADDNNPWSIYWVHFTGETGGTIVKELQEMLGFKGILRHKEKTIDLFDKIYSQLEKGFGRDAILSASLCMSHFLGTFLFGQKLFSSGKSDQRDPLENVIDYLHRHLDKTVSVEEMAAVANLSLSHFSFLFKNKTGLSPIEFFNHLKVQQAEKYLQFTKMRIKEIALEVGISDQYYFSRMFTKETGMSPIEYREKFAPKTQYNNLSYPLKKEAS